MSSAVLFTDDNRAVIDLMATATTSGRRFFVHGKNANISGLLPAAEESGFEVVRFDRTTAPENSRIQHATEDSDLFVLYHTYPAAVPDRNLGTYQARTRGTKLVVEDHPFCGKGAVWPMYFPFSYVDKSLIGYPHSYAFRDASDPDAWDVRRLADKVRPAARATMSRVFQDNIDTVEVSLTAAELTAYEVLKERLFEVESTPLAIIRKLKAFVDGTDTMKGAVGKQKGLPLLDINKVWPAYQAGLRKRFVSDAKVDTYLAREFDSHISNANGFLEALHG